MLVLTRKVGEKILIGDNVEVTVLTIRGNTVQLGTEAPRHIKIVRQEIHRTEETDKQPAE